MFLSSPGFTPRWNNVRKTPGSPYCQCWSKISAPRLWRQMSACSCGEDHDVHEWKWDNPITTGSTWVVLSDDQKQVTFHPYYSSGTATVRGDTPMLLNHHYYWEIKMLTDTYGTDIMVGLGTNKVNISGSQFEFTSLLGQDEESYGLSYLGKVRHNAAVVKRTHGFCRGTIIGVKVDLWAGTLEFFINRKSQGISSHNLRRHQALYPMISSTAAQSSMRLIYSASWKASLLVDAARILGATVTEERKPRIPPGLWNTLKSQFWMTLPTHIIDDNEEDHEEIQSDIRDDNVLSEVMPSQYANGFYIDNVERDYRIVVRE
ncbi:hypothetical protein K1T71_007577 [Dendrolimus kikuchii]|uniref:Uncharacterized protein n=1 Tax=Dendrolimus kikuchii TaxID=765133 RepID=A0ACC1CYH6_9NEOP|nr:hypothetical protein K1T71_007577 [Dendrolimus kikuchii]